MEYESPPQLTKQKVLSILRSGKEEMIPYALLGMVNGVDDYEWVLSTCLKYVTHPNEWAAKTAICCLGHIARIYGELDLARVAPILESAKQRPELANQVQEACEEIQLFSSPATRRAKSSFPLSKKFL